jgi:transposase InsO family protein
MACTAAGVSRQAFYDWVARQAAGPTPAQLAESGLVAEMRKIHDELDDTYGSPRMGPELANRGLRVNHKRVERLMRVHGIVGVFKPAKVRTTIPAEENPPLPDLVGRRFAPGRPDVVWCGDITYVRTGEGWLYVASVLDLGSRRLLGYAMASHMRTELIADALKMAAATRGGVTAGIIFHGDRGSQTGPAPDGRSSDGSTPTTTSGSTRASATRRPSPGRTSTVPTQQPGPTEPRKPSDRPTGGPSDSSIQRGRLEP